MENKAKYNIEKLIPHRYPFLMIDKVLEVKDDKIAIGIKNVTHNEHFFQGHFPGQPIMPGVLVVEAMAQLCGIVLLRKAPDRNLALFVGIDKVRFRKQVVPGDRIILEVEMLKFRRIVSLFKGKATVDEQVVAEAEMMFAFPNEG